jgi:S-(hydroxymethyl)glutathione dehydrogenase/alcohol dehydrogenase
VRAAVLHQPGTLTIEDVLVDDVGPREVRVRTRATGLCHSDLHFIEGHNAHPLPVVLGHEAAGIVEAVGRDVGYVEVGDHVIVFTIGFCGQCEFCLKGRPTLCADGAVLGRPDGEPPRLRFTDGAPVNQFAGLATFAEEMLVHENKLVKISKDVPFDSAALVSCGVATGLGAVLRCARVEPGSNVAVIGCGGIGLNTIQGAVIAGADRVIAIDRNDAKLERARQFGATDTINSSGDDAVERIVDVVRGKGGVDHAFEAVGLKATCELAFKILRVGGTATIIGVMPDNATIELPGLEFLMEKRIQGTSLGSVRFREDIPYFIDLYMQGRLHLDKLVSSRIPLEKINDGYARIGDGDIARTVVVFD